MRVSRAYKGRRLRKWRKNPLDYRRKGNTVKIMEDAGEENLENEWKEIERKLMNRIENRK